MSVSNFQKNFPFTPNDMSWEDWNGNFIMYFGEEPIAYHSEDEWQIAASQIASLPTFSVYPVPMPDGFPRWQEWAIEVTEIINGRR